jgi:integrase/recombinase XerD
MPYENFRKHLLVKVGLRQITALGYIKCVDLMVRRIGKKNPSEKEVIDYITWMHDKGYSFSYTHQSIRTAELWSEYNGKKIRLGRQKKPRPLLKDILSEAEIVNMFHHAKNIREKAMLAVLAYGGLRNKELCDLKVGSIDLGTNVIKVIAGKGIKDGLCYVAPQCTHILIRYLQEFPRSADEFLFTTLVRNNQYRGSDLRKLIKAIARRAGIGRRVWPHLLRHSLATHLLNRGASIFTVKDQLRHEWIATTMWYVRSLPFGVKNEYQKFVPSYV